MTGKGPASANPLAGFFVNANLQKKIKPDLQ
jgi:hypothetical protein